MFVNIDKWRFILFYIDEWKFIMWRSHSLNLLRNLLNKVEIFVYIDKWKFIMWRSAAKSFP